MTRAFLDTAYLIALVSSDDEFHDRAVRTQERFRGTLVTTEYVLLELLDAMTSGDSRDVAVSLVSSVRRDPGTTVIPASTALFDAGLRLFSGRPDKQWGITDCISFVVMQEQGINQALTADRHFEQAGFEALLR